ncbi:7561_t:CDS:2 [Acaulospora morrowiae]|uniref:7561_t:CDS:1 n=1 Tax=Acaulospora morrowiae TaxID=94023 RepID=A0A9N9D1T1_9GLOM|nr:7561_t:CDS:2 [Acaulospora morrowiae]
MRVQYIWGLNLMNQYNVQMMAKYYDTRDNITKTLVETEKFLLLQDNFPFPSSGGQKNQITLSQNNFKKIIADSVIDDTDLLEEAYDYDCDPIEDLRKQFKNLNINQAKLA